MPFQTLELLAPQNCGIGPGLCFLAWIPFPGPCQWSSFNGKQNSSRSAGKCYHFQHWEATWLNYYERRGLKKQSWKPDCTSACLQSSNTGHYDLRNGNILKPSLPSSDIRTSWARQNVLLCRERKLHMSWIDCPRRSVWLWITYVSPYAASCKHRISQDTIFCPKTRCWGQHALSPPDPSA